MARPKGDVEPSEVNKLRWKTGQARFIEKQGLSPGLENSKTEPPPPDPPPDTEPPAAGAVGGPVEFDSWAASNTQDKPLPGAKQENRAAASASHEGGQTP